MRVLTKTENTTGFSISSGDLLNAINKLGCIEKEAFDLIHKACDEYCVMPERYSGSMTFLSSLCEACPLTKLADLIYKDEGSKQEGRGQPV